MSWLASLAKTGIAIVTVASRLEKQEKKMEEIEKNYLSRFEDMTSHITQMKEDIIKHQHAMEIRLMNKMK